MATEIPSDPFPLPANSAGWALFLDIDGTLLDIAESPSAAVVPASLTDDLARVSARLGGAVALVSGRSIEWIDAAFHPLRLPAAGQHGAQIRLAPDQPVAASLPTGLDEARARINGLSGIEGIEIEDKGLSIAVHYRRAAARRPEVGALIAAKLANLSAGLEVLAGRFVYDVKARGIDKGTAIARLTRVPPFAGRTPVFVGDDRTDEDGFREVAARGGVAIRVGASAAVPGCRSIENPAAVRRWLATLCAGGGAIGRP